MSSQLFVAAMRLEGLARQIQIVEAGLERYGYRDAPEVQQFLHSVGQDVAAIAAELNPAPTPATEPAAPPATMTRTRASARELARLVFPSPTAEALAFAQVRWDAVCGDATQWHTLTQAMQDVLATFASVCRRASPAVVDPITEAPIPPKESPTHE